MFQCEADSMFSTLHSHRHDRAELRASPSRQAAQPRKHSDAEHGRQGNIEGDHLGTPYGEAKPARPRWGRTKHLRTAMARSQDYPASSRGASLQRRHRQNQPVLQVLRPKRTHHSRFPALKTLRQGRPDLQRTLLLLENLCQKRLGSL